MAERTSPHALDLSRGATRAVRSRSPRARLGLRALAALAIAAGLGVAAPASADDLAGIVARAREQVENGNYNDALRTLGQLPTQGLPQTLAVEAGLLETTASLVAKGEGAGQAACAKAIGASGYDPDVARDLSPKVRTACRAAATKLRSGRLSHEHITLSDFSVQAPDVAWQPVRIEAKATSVPPWLRVVARVTSSALEGSFDLALAPSIEGPLRGTLDASWIRPGAKIDVQLVAQDKYGDLGGAIESSSITVPRSEALVALGDVPSGATASVDGSKVDLDAHGRVAVSPGSHTIALELANGSSASTKIDVKRGAVSRVALSPQRPQTGRTVAWIAAGTTVALGAVGGVLLLTANGQRQEIEDLAQKREPGTNLPATSYADIQAKDQSRKTLVTTGSAFLIAGGVVGLTALTIFLWPDSSSSKKTGSTSVAPVVGLGSVGLRGAF